jgi:hydrogenase-4 component B
MTFLLAGVGILFVTGIAAVLLVRAPAVGRLVAVVGCVLGAGAVLVDAVPAVVAAHAVTVALPWQIPQGGLSLRLDALSALFLTPIAALSAVAAIYGAVYLSAMASPIRRATHWLAFNLLVASMTLVVVAANGLSFLIAWEVMALASFVLVLFDGDKPQVRQAAWVYFVATHLGTAALLVFFMVAASGAASMDFDAIARAAAGLPVHVLFLLAVVGFGTKAGFMPFHVWLPEAHPAAPSHVSAVMSGVMIKTGIYALIRALTLLGPPPAWWGGLLLALGIVSGVLGVLFALVQHDLKRLLAYHSVENIGIIGIGLGLGLLGQTFGLPLLVALGFGGALLHVVNHAAFKGLLFLGAGAVAHATGTRDIDHLGGLLRRMPWTGVTFLIGAAAISGLPPLNGFVSELLIYLGAFGAGMAGTGSVAVAAVTAIAALALIGGLAAACFTKAFGIVFLGEPRTGHAALAHEVPPVMRVAMVVLAVACVGIAVFAPWVVGGLAGPVAVVTRLSVGEVATALNASTEPLFLVAFTALALVVLVLTLVVWRFLLLRGRPVTQGLTWDCGYAHPTPRMQYTSSSFAAPLTDMFQMFLRTRRRFVPPTTLFPAQRELATETPDTVQALIYGPIFTGVANGLARLRRIQAGRVQLYVLYLAVTLVALLVWGLRTP